MNAWPSIKLLSETISGVMDPFYQGKTALITGAGKGIGRGLAKKLNDLGARTIALSRTQEDLETLKAESPGIQTHQIDLGNWDTTRKLVESLGSIDLLVNNAGIARKKSFLETEKATLEEIFDVNYKAAFNISQVVARSMVKRGVPGSIVHVSSVAAHIAFQDLSVYCSTKGALNMLTKAMAFELGPHKIRVNSVNPTIIWTKMGQDLFSDNNLSAEYLARVPMGNFPGVDDVVNSVVFLLSDKAGMNTGVNLRVDAGMTIH